MFMDLSVLTALCGAAMGVLFAGFLAYRSHRSLVTAAMVFGALFLLIGTILATLPWILIEIANSFAAGGLVDYPDLARTLILLGLPFATIGLIDLNARYGSTKKRADDLEALVDQLQQEQDGKSSPQSRSPE